MAEHPTASFKKRKGHESKRSLDAPLVPKPDQPPASPNLQLGKISLPTKPPPPSHFDNKLFSNATQRLGEPTLLRPQQHPKQHSLLDRISPRQANNAVGAAQETEQGEATDPEEGEVDGAALPPASPSVVHGSKQGSSKDLAWEAAPITENNGSGLSRAPGPMRPRDSSPRPTRKETSSSYDSMVLDYGDEDDDKADSSWMRDSRGNNDHRERPLRYSANRSHNTDGRSIPDPRSRSYERQGDRERGAYSRDDQYRNSRKRRHDDDWDNSYYRSQYPKHPRQSNSGYHSRDYDYGERPNSSYPKKDQSDTSPSRTDYPRSPKQRPRPEPPEKLMAAPIEFIYRSRRKAYIPNLTARPIQHPDVPKDPTPDQASYHGCSDLKSRYTQSDKLGEGTFGVVWKGTVRPMIAAPTWQACPDWWSAKNGLDSTAGSNFGTTKVKQPVDHQVVAVKKIILHKIEDGFPITSLREIKALKQLDHPNIVSLLDMTHDDDTEDKSKRASLSMVFPYMEHDLVGLLENSDVVIDVPIAKLFAKQLLTGIQFLHAHNMIHRDIKAANLLINNEGLLQIADFGLVRCVTPSSVLAERGEKPRYTREVVTRWYRPPEVLLSDQAYGPAVDMWGIGCVVAEMFIKTPLFPGESDVDQAARIFHLCGSPNDNSMPGWRDLPGIYQVKDERGQPVNPHKEFETRSPQLRSYFLSINSSEKFGDLMEGLLKLNPRDRLSALEAGASPWFFENPLAAPLGSFRKVKDSHEFDRVKRQQAQARMAFARAPSAATGIRPNTGPSNRPPQQLPPHLQKAQARSNLPPHPQGPQRLAGPPVHAAPLVSQQPIRGKQERTGRGPPAAFLKKK